MIHCEKLSSLLQEDEDLATAAQAEADSSCTGGYDNDGLTGFEIFKNGFYFAQDADGEQVFWAEAPNLLYFFYGYEDEDALIEHLQGVLSSIGCR